MWILDLGQHPFLMARSTAIASMVDYPSTTPSTQFPRNPPLALKFTVVATGLVIIQSERQPKQEREGAEFEALL